MPHLEEATNSEIIKRALEYVLEVYEDMDSLQSFVGEGSSESLDEGLELAALSLNELVKLYKACQKMEKDPSPPPEDGLSEETELLGPDLYVSASSLPSLLDTTEYEN